MSSRTSDSALNALEREFVKERAEAVGRMGRKLEQALQALRQAPPGNDDAREALVQRAAYAAWEFFVQREACGMRNHSGVIEAYAIPSRVLALMGGPKPRGDREP